MRGRWVSFFVAAVAAILLLSAPAASADQIKTFILTTDPSNVDGSVTIDTTTGVMEAIDLNFIGRPYYELPVFTDWGPLSTAPPYPSTGFSEIWNDSQGDFYFSVDIALPVATLVGYTGGNICSTTFARCDGYLSASGNIVDTPYISGLLTPVPEPSSLLLLSMGALGLVGLFRRKFLA